MKSKTINPEVEEETSKTISIQVDPEMYKYVKSQAKAEGRSMGNWIKRLIEARQEFQPGPTNYSRLQPQLIREGER